MHLCAQEVVPALMFLGSLPLIGAWLKDKLRTWKRRQAVERPHCCDPTHPTLK